MKQVTEEKVEGEEEKKKSERKTGAQKRRKAKKRDKLSRWGGLILFVVLFLLGVLMWVSGQIRMESEQKTPLQLRDNQTEQGRVVIR